MLTRDEWGRAIFRGGFAWVFAVLFMAIALRDLSPGSYQVYLISVAIWLVISLVLSAVLVRLER